MTDHLDAHLHAAPMAAGPTGPLRGLRILDVTHALAGPYGSLLLADLGADVIKVEPPSGELVRFTGPWVLDDEERLYSGRYANRNRNKRSICLDLADEADRETFLQLVETADGLIENMRAGVLDRLGVGWEDCQARNPRLVYVAVRGFGDPRTGNSPYTDWPAFDPIAQAMGGIVSATGEDADHPVRVGAPIGDTVPGLFGALGMVSAIFHARQSGQGQFVDVAMVDAMMALSESSQLTWSYMGKPQKPAGNAMDGISPFDIYRTADGHCAIAAPTDRMWPLLCEAIGRPDLVEDPRTKDNRQRVRNRDIVDGAVGGWAAQHATMDIVAALGDKVPVGPVMGPAEWVHDPHVAAREMLVRIDHPHHRPTVHLNCPVKFTETPAGVWMRPAILDEHGPELRAELAARAEAKG